VTDAEATVQKARPDFCFKDPSVITSDAKNDATISTNAKAVTDIDPETIQKHISDLVQSVPEAQSFVVVVKDQAKPTTNSDGSVTVQVVVIVSGNRDPTATEQDGICRKVIVPAVQLALNDNSVKITLALQSCVPATSSAKKRGILQSNGNQYIASMSGTASAPGPGSGTGSAATLFVSLAALFLAAVALLF